MKTICLFFFAVFLAARAGAQWEKTTGPFGGPVSCFAEKKDSLGGTVLFAGAKSTVYVSANNGQSWTAASRVWSETYEVKSLLVIGQDILVTAGGIYRSADNGKTWITLVTGAWEFYDALLSASGSTIFAGGRRVYFSTNNGVNWVPFSADLDNDVRALTVKGTDIIVGTYNGVYICPVSGTSWRNANAGLPEDRTINSIAVSGANIFAAVGSRGVFLSANNGESWSDVSSGLPNDTAYHGSEKHILVNSLAADGKNLYAGISSGFFSGTSSIYFTTDNGTSWKNIGSGLPGDLYFNDLFVSGNNIFAGTNRGIYRSTDNGIKWTDNNSGISNTFIKAITADGPDIYAAVSQAFTGEIRFSEVNFSSNSGLTWVQRNSGLPEKIDVSALTIKDGNVFAGTSKGIYLLEGNKNIWINRSTGLPLDTPANWSFNYFNVYSFLASGNNLFAATTRGVYLSENNGESWLSVNKGLPADSFTYFGVKALASCGTKLFAGTASGVYVSTDNGTSWKSALLDSTGYPGLPAFININALASCDSHLFAGTWIGIHHSTDFGRTWTTPTAGLPQGYSNIIALLTCGKSLFALRDDDPEYRGRLFVSTDYGKNWRIAGTGFPGYSYDVNNIAASNTDIFAATNEGVWKCPLSKITSAEALPWSGLPEKFSLEQNYPNPFNPATTISFSLPYPAFVTLKVYDLPGRETAVLVNEEKKAGVFRVIWRPEDLPSGVYFYQIKAGSFIKTKKLIFLK
ncbi:MAG: T9SS type A sorting domain-containing protein [archaeon]